MGRMKQCHSCGGFNDRGHKCPRLDDQTNDPGYWKWVIQKAEDDIAEALKQIERLEREQEAGDLSDEPF